MVLLNIKTEQLLSIYIQALLHASGLLRTLWREATCHVVWLMNWTTTKALTNKTPYEAAFGKKPDLSEIQEWEDKVWVQIEGGDKLGGQVREGHWVGISDESKVVCVYWPDTKHITTKCNIYFDKTIMSSVVRWNVQCTKQKCNQFTKTVPGWLQQSHLRCWCECEGVSVHQLLWES